MSQSTSEVAPCPKCGSTNAKKVSYTWWGGALGPRLLHEVKCLNCGTSYNGSTGKSNVTNIIIYSVAAAIIVLVVLALINGVH